MIKSKKILSVFLLIMIVVGVFTGCNVKEDKSFQSMEDFESAVIGVMNGSSFDLLASEYYPTAEKRYLNMPDLILNLQQEKINGILMDMGFYTPIIWEGESLSYIEMDMPATEYAVAFPKAAESEALMAQFNEFIRSETENGGLAELEAKWLSASEPDGSIDFTQLTGENGTLHVATTVESKPFSYLKEGKYYGYDADFLFRFAKEYGYALRIDQLDFGALLPGLTAGRFDLAVSGITVTEERRETVLFSDAYYRSPIIMAVLAEGKGANTEPTFADFEQAKIGVLTGSSHDKTAQEIFPNAERVYFNNMSDMILAVEQGKIDCYLEDAQFLAPLIWEGVNLKQIDESVRQMSNGFVFPKGESTHLREQINEFLGAAKTDGTIERLTQKWLGKTEPTEHPDYSELTGENGTIRLAISVDNKPMLYQNADGFTGFEMELLTAFGQRYGYKFDIEVVPFESIIAGISANKYDMGASSLNITDERKESVDFSDAYNTFETVIAVKGDSENKAHDTLSDLENATLGIITGTNYDNVAKEKFPNAERMYFSTSADVLLALKQGKVDAYFADKVVLASMQWENQMVDYIDEPVEMISNALILAKEGYDPYLLAQLNEFIGNSKNNGTLERLEEKWVGDTEPSEHPDYTKLTGENGTLKIAVSDSLKPVSYQKGSMYTGYEVDFLTLFAEEYGYKLEIQGMAFDALIPSVASGKCDIGASAITITPERAESVTFTDPHFETYGVAIIRRENAAASSAKTLADFENATLGVMTGSVYDDYAKERFPNAKREYYNMISDMIVAVEQEKIDGYLSESTYVTAAIWEGAKIQSIDEAIDHTQAAYIFQKSEQSAQLREQLNSFIRAAKENGTLDELAEKWFGKTEPAGKLDFDALTGENGTIRIAVAPDLKPISYIKDGELTGYEMEILLLFAKEYGYKLDLSYMTFDAILPGVTTGKYDIGTGAVTITEERAQSLDFSESHLTVDVVMVVKAEPDSAAQNSFWNEVKEDFEKTFIREDRWKLIVEGIGVTMLISLCAAAAGSLLGFGLYMLSRSEVKLFQLLAKGIASVYSRIIAGTPVVVILMILFYVIFGKVRDMSGILVAIIGFTLTFGAFVYDHMTVSVGSVDRGQTEAAYALGYTKNKTFFRIIFPQAMTIFLPSYCGQAVELIKATAVVGYVAVNDLTKMGDIIRSNTYEAFFPLIATAVIYFLLTWILASLLKLLKLRFEPKRRRKEDILKGVKTV